MHALQLAFIAEGELLSPIGADEENVVLVETPNSHKLLLDLFVSNEPGPLYAPPPRETSGDVLKRLHLRGGRTVHLVGRARQASAQDLVVVSELMEQLSVSLKTRLVS